MQTLEQLLPPAEMGTAQQEIPVAKLETTHTLQLTTEELSLLHTALKGYLLQYQSEEESGVPFIIGALEDTLRAPFESALECEELRKQHRSARFEIMRMRDQAAKLPSTN